MLKKLFALSIAIAAVPAWADDIECRSSIGSRIIDGNVIVPPNRSCTLTGTTVKGGVELRDGAQVLIRANANVYGNVQTDGAARVRIRASEIGGSVQLTGIDSDLESLVLNSRIGGTVDWNGNTAPFMIRYSNVDSDIKVNQNNARARVYDNTVGGNLQCQSNEPRPLGARNIVDGNKEGQCSRF